MPDLEWMAWTRGTALFVCAVFVGLGLLAAFAVVSPSSPRKGFLPMPTARGDRVYVALLGTALILIVVMATTTWAVTSGLAVAAVWAAVVLRWG